MVPSPERGSLATDGGERAGAGEGGGRARLTVCNEGEARFVRVEELVARHGCPDGGEEQAAEGEGGDEGDEEHDEHHAPGRGAQGSGRRPGVGGWTRLLEAAGDGVEGGQAGSALLMTYPQPAIASGRLCQQLISPKTDAPWTDNRPAIAHIQFVLSHFFPVVFAPPPPTKTYSSRGLCTRFPIPYDSPETYRVRQRHRAVPSAF